MSAPIMLANDTMRIGEESIDCLINQSETRKEKKLKTKKIRKKDITEMGTFSPWSQHGMRERVGDL